MAKKRSDMDRFLEQSYEVSYLLACVQNIHGMLCSKNLLTERELRDIKRAGRALPHISKRMTQNKNSPSK